jgi:TolA-binding protein
MKNVVYGILAILLLITACTPSQPPTPVTNETNETKTIKYTIPDNPVEEAKLCQAQIDELKEQKIEDEYDVLQLSGDQQKISMELQFKKDNEKYQKEVEGLTNKLKQVSTQVKDLKAEIASKKDAIRLLEEKCNLKK